MRVELVCGGRGRGGMEAESVMADIGSESSFTGGRSPLLSSKSLTFSLSSLRDVITSEYHTDCLSFCRFSILIFFGRK